jgi:hypothetical protein
LEDGSRIYAVWGGVRRAFSFDGLSDVSLEAFGIMLDNWGDQLGLLEQRRYRRGRRGRRVSEDGGLFEWLDRERAML